MKATPFFKAIEQKNVPTYTRVKDGKVQIVSQHQQGYQKRLFEPNFRQQSLFSESVQSAIDTIREPHSAAGNTKIESVPEIMTINDAVKTIIERPPKSFEIKVRTMGYKNRGKQFVAKITGPNAKYKFEREFVGSKLKNDSDTTVAQITDIGLYQERDIDKNGSPKDLFFVAWEDRNGLMKNYVDESDVKRLVNDLSKKEIKKVGLEKRINRYLELTKTNDDPGKEIRPQFYTGLVNIGETVTNGELFEWRKKEIDRMKSELENIDKSPEIKQENTIEPKSEKITLYRENYGYDPGQTIYTKKHGFVTIVTTGSRYYREDGMSFGLSDESGTLYYATARPATEKEAKPVRERLEKEVKKREILHAYDNLKQEIRSVGEIPKDVQPNGKAILDTANIYGGGDWWVIEPDYVWYVKNNGGDGDSWDLNNVRTGGAGAIGWRVPKTEELIKKLEEVERVLKE